MRKHAVPPGVTTYYRDQQHGRGGGANSCERAAQRSGKESPWTPATAATGTQGSHHVCFAENHTTSASSCCKCPYCTGHRQASAKASATKDPILLDKPGTASAAEAPHNRCVAGGKSSNHCWHTPCRLSGVWQRSLQPLSAITPLPSHP